MSGCAGLDACARTRAGRAARACSAILPWLMRATSSRSSTRRVRWLHLAVDDVGRPGQLRVGRRDAADHLDRVADRRQRVAQLVRQHREELVLAPVRLPAARASAARARRSRPAGCGRGARSRARSRRGRPARRASPVRASCCALLVGRAAARRARARRRSAARPAAERGAGAAGSASAASSGAGCSVGAARSAAQRSSTAPCSAGGRRRIAAPSARAHRHAARGRCAGRPSSPVDAATSAATAQAAAPAARAARACRPSTSSEPLEHAARVRQEGRAPRRSPRPTRARRLGGGQRDALVGLAAHPPLHQVQVDEHLHLGAQHLGHHRRQDVVDRAERVAARGLHLVGVGGDEDDRRVRRALVAGGSARRSRSRRCPAC